MREENLELVALSETVAEALPSARLEMDGDGAILRGVTLIEVGLSKNRRFYREDTLRTFGPQVFEGVEAYATNHVKAQKNLHSLIGVYRNVRFEENRLRADLHVFPSALTLVKKALEAERALGSQRIGLSIDTAGEVTPNRTTGFNEVTRLMRTPETSVDLVMSPAARGRLSENSEQDQMNENPECAAAEAVETAAVEVEVAVETVVETVVEVQAETAVEAVEETVETPVETVAEVTAEAPQVDLEALVEARVQAALKAEEQKRLLEAKLTEAKDLPASFITLLREQYEGKEFAPADIDGRISSFRDDLGKRAATRVNIPGTGTMTKVVIEAEDKQRLALYGLVSGKDQRAADGTVIPAYRSIKRAVCEMAGVNPLDDKAIVRAVAEAFAWGGDLNTRVAEAISTSTFNDAFADAMYRSLMDAARDPELNTWREWCTIVPFENLTVERKFVQVGAYGNLPTVAENGAYQPLTSPTDRKVSFVPSKIGGNETLSWEAILRDDVRLLQRIPQKLGQAYARTIHDGVYGALQANAGLGPTMDYDTVALYDATHNNLPTLANLSAAQYKVARNLLMNQVDMSSGKKLGLRPGFILVASPELDETAYELFTSGVPKSTTNNDATMPSFIANNGVKVINVAYPTATVQRAELLARKEDIDLAYVGFLNGNDEPEILVADNPSVGAMLSNDQIVIRIKGNYGFQVANHEGFALLQDNS